MEKDYSEDILQPQVLTAGDLSLDGAPKVTDIYKGI